jgi:hypothetical protein
VLLLLPSPLAVEARDVRKREEMGDVNEGDAAAYVTVVAGWSWAVEKDDGDDKEEDEEEERDEADEEDSEAASESVSTTSWRRNGSIGTLTEKRNCMQSSARSVAPALAGVSWMWTGANQRRYMSSSTVHTSSR